MKNLLRLSFLPVNADCGLLLLRLWVGISMLLIHGWPKLSHFSQTVAQFPDPLHVGTKVSLGLSLCSEVLGSVLLILGLFTRFGALLGVINMAIAFTMVHHHAFQGEHSGELAFIYLGAYLALLFAGGGRMAVDGK
jgi:putative oxidoreductase